MEEQSAIARDLGKAGVQVQNTGDVAAALALLEAAPDRGEPLRIAVQRRARRPVLVVWGKQDPNVPFELSDALMHQLPFARLLAVDDSGHLPQWEQPGVVQPAVIAFLREVRP